MRIASNRDGKKVKFGKEDLFLVFIVALLLLGLSLEKLTFEEVLGYFGVTGAGGIWGMLGGNASS